MTHHLRYDVNCSMLFTELPLLDRPRAAKAAGFDAVEFWWPFAVAVPGDDDVDAFVSAIEDAGVQLVGLNFFAGNMPGGDRGLVSLPARSAEFHDNVDVTIGIGQRLGCRLFNALYGNRVDGVPSEQQDEQAAANLALAATAAARVGGTVVLEPLSGVDRFPLRTVADALAVLDRVRRTHEVPDIALLADLYHLAVNGDGVDSLTANAGRIAHVQIADAPGRGEPGTGQLPLMQQLESLEAAGYAGWVGLEYKPSTPDTRDSLTWLPPDRRGEQRPVVSTRKA